MTKVTRTQVAVIGAGPAGLLLSELLRNVGIDSIVIDRQSRSHIEARIRAGVLEWGTVEALREVGIGERMDSEGIPHSGFEMCFDGRRHRMPHVAVPEAADLDRVPDHREVLPVVAGVRHGADHLAVAKPL